MTCYVRLMHREDVSSVTKIDREAFPTLWPPTNYERELKNRLASYVVACDKEEEVEEFGAEVSLKKDSSNLVSRVRDLFNHNRFVKLVGRKLLVLLGFGLWLGKPT